MPVAQATAEKMPPRQLWVHAPVHIAWPWRREPGGGGGPGEGDELLFYGIIFFSPIYNDDTV